MWSFIIRAMYKINWYGPLHHHHCVRPLVSGGAESLVGRAVQGCCVVHVVVVVVPSFCVGWLWSWSKMHLMLVAVVFRLLVLLENISLLYTLNSPTRWRTSHSSRTCCWVSVWLPHALHVWVWCLFLKLFFTGSILDLALKMVLAWGLVSFFI